MKRGVQIGLVILILIILGLAIAVVLADAPQDPSAVCHLIGDLPSPYPYPIEECNLFIPHVAK